MKTRALRRRRTDTILIVDVVDLLQAETFSFVQELFFLEDTFVEELLQFLIAVARGWNQANGDRDRQEKFALT